MKALFNLSLLLITLYNANAQTGIWEYYAPLPIDGGNVSKIVVDTNNTILFEYTKDYNGGSLLSSSDKGLTFHSEGTRWLNTKRIEINPKYNTLFLGDGQNGVDFTMDKGANWDGEYFCTMPTSGLHSSTRSLNTNPFSGHTYFSGTKCEQTWPPEYIHKYSTNNGTTWNNYNFSEFHFLSEMVFVSAQVGLAFSETRIYKTIDGGLNWALTSFSGGSIKSLIKNDNDKYFVSTDNGIYTSDDLGNNWNHEAPLASFNQLYYDTIQNIYYASDQSDGVFKSFDGITWSNINYNLLGSTKVNHVTTDLDGDVFIALDQYFIAYKPQNDTIWQLRSTELGFRGSLHYAFSNTGELLTANQAGISVYNSSNDSWEITSQHAVRSIELANASSTKFIFSPTLEMFFLKDGEYLLSSIDGMDWDTLIVPENSSFFCDSNLIYIHDQTFEPYRIFTSIDSAQTFTFLKFLTHEINEIKQGNILHTVFNPSILGLSCAVNDTLTFGPEMNVFPFSFIDLMFKNDSMAYVIHDRSKVQVANMFDTTDYQNIESVDWTIGGDKIISHSKTNALGELYCNLSGINSGTNLSFVRYSNNIWDTLGYPPGSNSVTSIFFDINSNVYLATDLGIYKWRMSLQSIEEETMSIFKVFPNPSTGHYTFTSPLKDIKVYNTIGELLFIDEYANEIDISNFPSGTYLLTGISNTQIKKIIIKK